MASAYLVDEAKEDLRALIAEDREVARECLRIAKELEATPYLGEPLREKSNLRPLGQAVCRKVKFDHPNRSRNAEPRYRYRLVDRSTWRVTCSRNDPWWPSTLRSGTGRSRRRASPAALVLGSC